MCCQNIVPVMISLTDQALVVQTLDSTIHRINLYPEDSAIGFSNTYPLDSDLSGGLRCPAFEEQELTGTR